MASNDRKPGFFITLEGIEGVCKTTHAEFLSQRLRELGRRVRLTREPGGTVTGEAIRNLLLQQRTPVADGMAELLLMFAARAQHLAEVVRPALAACEIIVCDRFTDATYAYQGGGRGVPREQIAWLEDRVQRGLRPDMTLVFDAPVEVGLKRARGRGDGNRFEDEDVAFFTRVRETYLAIARSEPTRVHIINVDRPLAAVQDDLRALIRDLRC